MLQLLNSLFRGKHEAGDYPESLVKEAVERAVDGTDPWIRGVSGYRKKLRPAVVRAIDHVVTLVDGLPSPLSMDPADFHRDPRLSVFFVAKEDVAKLLEGDRSLAEFRRGEGGGTTGGVALLAMEKQEKTTFGAALIGDIVQRDVPQTTVGFTSHRLFEPAEKEEEARRRLKRRAFDHLLSLALGQITRVKAERKDLERCRALFQAKLELLRRGGWDFSVEGPAERLDKTAVEEDLERNEIKLLELGREDRVLEDYLDLVAEVLGSPEKHLWAAKEILTMDRMGFKQSKGTKDALEVSLDVLSNSEGRKLVVALVRLPVPGGSA